MKTKSTSESAFFNPRVLLGFVLPAPVKQRSSKAIWSGFGGACETGGSGDPVLLYDHLANRWMITQFASATGGAPITDECVAISTTADATGTYARDSSLYRQERILTLRGTEIGDPKLVADLPEVDRLHCVNEKRQAVRVCLPLFV